MAYYIAVGGSTVYQLTTAGVKTALTLPTGITIDTSRLPRLAVLKKAVVVTNAGTRGVWVDPNLVVRPMMIAPPSSPVSLSSPDAGTLSGNFKVKYTYIIKDSETGAVLQESDFSPASAASGTIASKKLQVNGVGVSPDTQVTHRRMYRTTTGPGSVYFSWFDLDGNTATVGSDDLADAALSLVAAPSELGSGPGMVPGTFMTLCVEWKGRLWGVGNNDVDTLRASGLGLFYGWPSGYAFPIKPIGSDQFGITGLIPRRDELGVARRGIIWKVTGGDSGMDTINVDKLFEGRGVIAPDSVKVIRDVGYWLAEDGVYMWDPDGVRCISDGAVRGWFTTDTYFNRSRFQYAFGKYNPKYHTYDLHLASAGQTTLDRWVSYDIGSKRWWGPHKTDAPFVPTCGGTVIDTNNLTQPAIGGSDGFIRLGNQTAFRDDDQPINLDLLTIAHSADTPDIDKLFEDPSFVFKRQSKAGNMLVKAGVGAFDVSTQLVTPIRRTLTVDQTNRKGRQRFSPLGPGQFCQFQITEGTLDQGCELWGYEVPNHELGRR